MSARAATILTNHLLANHAARVTDLVNLGVSSSTVDRYRSGGLLMNLGSGIVCLADTPDLWAAHATAALLANPTAVLSHQSAAQLLGIGFHSREIHFTLANRSRAKGTNVVAHRTTLLPPHHRREVRGWPITNAARTLCDLAVTATDGSHYSSLVQAAITSGRVGKDELLSVHLDLAARGRKGARRRRSTFETLFADTTAIATSELEQMLADLLRAAAIEGVEWQYRPPWYDGSRGVVDAAIPAARLVIEVDGRRWHTTEQAFATDRARDRLAVEHGWAVLRFTWRDLRHRPDAVVASIRAVVHRASGSFDV